MPKMKTHKGLAKRITITAKNKISHKRSGGSHLMSTMNGRQVRTLRKPLVASAPIAQRYGRLLGLQLKGRDQA